VTYRTQPTAEGPEITATLRNVANSGERESRPADSSAGAWAPSTRSSLAFAGRSPVPARKEGRYFWLRHQVCLGIV
jgi:hypothetical protein